MTVETEYHLNAVELKQQIQSALLSERGQMGELQFNQRRCDWLESSEDVLAIVWRSIAPPQPTR